MSENSDNESELDRLDLTTPNFTDQNIMRIAELFPNVVTESRDEGGAVKHAIDFDALKQELSDNIVEGPQERYQLNWPGKRDAMQAANAPINKTLRPCREESVDFDTTKNLFIEGDNLDALKLLQETYLGKVKMIYIDPPYNTGKDFIYKDNFTVNKDEYLEESGQRDEGGGRLVANPESNGRYHSDWLSMMYPRLKLARNLLRDDGVIFISIDDGEVGNLRQICDQIFGGENFLANIVWRKKATPDPRSTIGSIHDHILCYLKSSEAPKKSISKMELSNKRIAEFKNPDNDERGAWVSVDMTGMMGRATKDQYFEVELPSGRRLAPPKGRSWGLIEQTFVKLKADNRIWFGKDGDNVPRIKQFLKESEGQTVPTFWSYQDVGSNEDASNEITNIFGAAKIFDTPKPTALIFRMLEIAANGQDDFVVLDFFSGSGSIAHATMNRNMAKNRNIRFVAVQVSEPTTKKSLALGEGYETIAEISKERIRRAGKKILEENPDQVGKLDVGFRVLKIESSNMTDVWHSPDQVSQDDLLSQVSNIKPDRTAEDLLFQVLLDWGVDLTLPIARESIEGKDVFFVDENALAACFDTGVSEELVKQIAQRKPLRVVFRDDGFDSDATKINVEQLFKHLSPHTEVKVI